MNRSKWLLKVNDEASLKYRSNPELIIIDKKREFIKKSLRTGKTYKFIGKKLGMTHQGVSRIVKILKLDTRNVRFKKKVSELYKSVMCDIDDGLSIDELLNKHKLSKQRVYQLLSPRFDLSIHSKLINNRDNKIINFFKINSATDTISFLNSTPKLIDRYNVKNIDSIYNIANKYGIKKQPNIVNRHLSAGIIYEDTKILKIIKTKHEKNKWSHIKIANYLNDLGYLTIGGVKFNYNLVRHKYIAYNKLLKKAKNEYTRS